ncbi:MAG: hypothetical protein FWD48_09070 [Oscillospiraceae bacterium]|nr:hypothetical protein [Oscillospiraceae bacterium]
MKNAILTVIIIFIVIAVTGGHARYFPRMTEITLAEPVFVIGIDRRVAGDGIGASSKVSIIYEKIESADEGGGDVNQRYVDYTEGSSPAAALETLKKRFPREMAVSTAEYFLIGEEAAEDLEKAVDFLAKNNALRLTASVFIVRGEASDACEILTETRTLDILRNYGEYSGINAISSSMEFYELLSKTAQIENNAFTVPALVFKEKNGEIIVVPSGYAIIKDGALAGFLEQEAARGYNLLTNKSVYSTIEFDDFATRLENAQRQISFEWDGDDLTGITVYVDFNASLIDSGGVSEDNLLLRKEQNRVIFAEIQKAVAVSKKLGCDFLGIGSALRMRHPLRWEWLGEHWDEIYSQVPVKINVDSRLA